MSRLKHSSSFSWFSPEIGPQGNRGERVGPHRRRFTALPQMEELELKSPPTHAAANFPASRQRSDRVPRADVPRRDTGAAGGVVVSQHHTSEPAAPQRP